MGRCVAVCWLCGAPQPSGPTVDQKLHHPRNASGEQFPWSGCPVDRMGIFLSGGTRNKGLDSEFGNAML